jgi:hypothetical protein
MKNIIEIIRNKHRTQYILNGNFHREDGPAIIWADGTECWYIHGKFHREGGPAFKDANGTEYWYIHGKYHREDGPAIEWGDGNKEYWYNGKRIDMLNNYESIEIDANLSGIEVINYLLMIQALR